MTNRASYLCRTLSVVGLFLGPQYEAGAADLVIPPGQEKLLAEMLGLGVKDLPGGCIFAKASAKKSVVVAEYTCGKKKKKAELRLVHPSADKTATVRTQAFALVPDTASPPPAPLLAALAERMRLRESGWKWVEAVAGASSGRKDATPGLVGKPATLDGLNPADAAEYGKGLELYREGKHTEALALYLGLARRNPKHGVLGMLVATLAPGMHDEEKSAALAAAAEAAPKDTLAQFVAGVAAHYVAHQAATSVEQKKRLYGEAVKYLSRTLPAYDFEPRVFIYLAVSHFRLGHQKKAETFIEKAVQLGSDDPDTYYCRAEIFQRTNRKRAIEDLQTYLEAGKRLAKAGAVVSAAKAERVERIVKELLAVPAGADAPVDLFETGKETLSAPTGGGATGPAGGSGGGDPANPSTAQGGGRTEAQPSASKGFGILVVAVAGAAFLLAMLSAYVARRRRRRREEQSAAKNV